MSAIEPLATPRCSVIALGRGDELLATAPPARRFLLLEVPGPWVPDAMAAAGLAPALMSALRRAMDAVHGRILLIRRPGRHPATPNGTPRRWALAAVPGSTGAGTSAAGGLRWGDWHAGADLLRIDPHASLPPLTAGPQRPVALVCTHGRHDPCCAIEGRPVAAAAAEDQEIDVWECSHLGGDRFAGNLLWLPSGLMFGGLTAVTTPAVLTAAKQGRVFLGHYRGRCGDPQPAQAAQWHLMHALHEDRPDRVVIERTQGRASDRPGDELWTAIGGHGADRYRIELEVGWSQVEQLTCRARLPSRSRTYRPLAPPQPLPRSWNPA